MFGAVRVGPYDAVRLINGLEIEKAVYRITEEPQYKENDFYFPVRPEYRRMYRIYGSIPDDMEVPGRPGGVKWYEDICAPARRNAEDEDVPRGVHFIGLALMNEENGHLIPEKIFI